MIENPQLHVVVVEEDPEALERALTVLPQCSVRTMTEALRFLEEDGPADVAVLRAGPNLASLVEHFSAEGSAIIVLGMNTDLDEDELMSLGIDGVYRGDFDENLRALVRVTGQKQRLLRESARLSKELRHGLRLEALGRIAGGVAHDFNNLLTTVGCFAGFIEEGGSPEAVDDAREILRASERGTDLTRRLVALSREREIRPESYDVSTVIADIQRLLAKSAGPAIRLSFDLRSGLSPILVDRSDLEQAVLHIVLQARESLSHGGQVVIQTWQRGRHVGVEVQDDGPGLPQDVLREIYSDDGELERRRLGLRAVREVVEQSGGVLELENKRGAGTTYRLIFDAVSARPAFAETEATVFHIDGAGRKVVLLELDAGVNRAARKQLERFGFSVEEVQSFAELQSGLHEGELADASFLLFDESLVDEERLAALRRSWPSIGLVLLVGGARVGPDLLFCSFLTKPFRADGLVRALSSAEAVVERNERSRPARVLIVDDDALTARSIERVLSGLCEPEHVFGDRQTVLSRIEAGGYDLVLCDVLMPGINGMQLFEWIRSRAPSMASRFVFLTAAADFDVIRTFADSIPNPVYSKPMDRNGFEALLIERGLI